VDLAMRIVGRSAFVALLLFLAGFGAASLIGYPGPFVLTAFSIGGLPFWGFFADRWRPWLAMLVAALAVFLPFWLLAIYTGDGDFSVQSLMAQYLVLGGMAYGLAWCGLAAGRHVWFSDE
jgi:hypothetical protein